MQVLLARGAYAPWVRENLVQAQYFKVGPGGNGCFHRNAKVLYFMLQQ
jgi:hypothetical protein